MLREAGLGLAIHSHYFIIYVQSIANLVALYMYRTWFVSGATSTLECESTVGGRGGDRGDNVAIEIEI